MGKQFRLKKYYLILILLLFLSSCLFKPDPAKVKIITYEAPTTENVKQWQSNCNNPLCRSLLNLINAANQSLDIAVYGVREQPEINQALYHF